jgi:type II secretory pathway pseudopilin PulG
MNRGLSLSETLVAITIFAVIGVVIVSMFIAQNSSFAQTLALSKAQQELARTMSVFSEWTSQAVEVTNYPESSPTVSSSANALVLKIPSIDSSQNILANTYDFVLFTQPSASSLSMQIISNGSGRSSSTTNLATTVANLRFVYNQPSAVTADRVSVRLSLDTSLPGFSRLASERTIFMRNFQ